MDKYKYSIETLTPVHIGTGEEIYPIDYVILEEPNKKPIVAIPDLEKIFAENPQVVNEFGNKISRMTGEEITRCTLGDLISPELLKKPENQKYNSIFPLNKVLPFLRDSIKGKRSNSRGVKFKSKAGGEIKKATKTPDHRAIIPGSSIKGALKTAWAYSQSKDDKNIILEIKRKIFDRNIKRKKLGQDAEGILNKNVFLGKKETANYDLFRVIRIADSEARKAEDVLSVIGEKVLSAGVYPNNRVEKVSYKSYWTFLEVIDQEMKLEGNMTFASELLGKAGILGWNNKQQSLNPQTLRKACNEFAADLCEYELNYFKKIGAERSGADIIYVTNFYQDLLPQIRNAPENTMYFSLGHGSGWHKLTIGLLLQGDRDFQRMRQNLNLADRYTQFEFPKSRKLVMYDKIQADSPLGWVKLTFEES